MKLTISRRHFLALLSGAAAASTLFHPTLALANTQITPDVEMRLTASPTKVSILQGNDTDVFGYKSKVIRADTGSHSAIPGSYLGTELKFRRGQKVRALLEGLPRLA